MGAGSVRAGSAPGQVGDGDPVIGRLPVQRLAADSPSVEKAAGVAGQRGGQAGGHAETKSW